MPAEFSRTEVEAVATLANLALSDEECDLFARQLSAVLEYARQLQQIGTDGVAPTDSVLLDRGPERPDLVTASLDLADALSNAPDAHVEAGLFKVPRVIG